MAELHLAAVFEAVAAAVPDRPALCHRGRWLTYGELAERSRRLASALISAGVRTDVDSTGSAPHESPHDHVALLAHNGSEYLEAMIGSFMARAAPCNVNARYGAEELASLLDDSRASVAVVSSVLTPRLAEVRDHLAPPALVLQVDDGSGLPLLEGARWYEDALAAASPHLDDELRRRWSPDDRYVLYTGGTTGRPRGVLWRHADIWVAAMGGRRPGTDEEWDGVDDLAAAAAAADGGARMMTTAPFMHGAAQWLAFNAFGSGNAVVLPDVVDHLDPDDVAAVIAREGVNVVLVVGDAMARPLVERLEAGGTDLSSLLMLVSGGAGLSAELKERFLAVVPGAMVLDGLGSSETGQQAALVSAAGGPSVSGAFRAGPDTVVLDEDRRRVLSPAETSEGWLARSGRIPLGYLGDPARTAATFPVVDGVRYAVAGDRGRWGPDGLLHFLGRDAATINTGGEKVFAEEVEAAIAAHPDVADVIVCGRPSERWGAEVVAVVALRAGATPDPEALAAAAGRHLARFKLPKAWCFVPEVRRSPAGKPDRRWAAHTATTADPSPL